MFLLPQLTQLLGEEAGNNYSRLSLLTSLEDETSSFNGL